MMIQEKLDSKQQSQPTPLDLSVLTLLSQQRAISLDHLPRFLALVEGKADREQLANSKSAIHNLVEHLQHAGLIHVQRFGRSTPDWIWLTKAGMQHIGLSTSSWKRPTRHVLLALHAANTIRLHLTERDSPVSWFSQQQLRSANAPKEPHLIPTAEVRTERGERVAVHVVLRLTRTEEQIATRMLQQLERGTRLEETPYSALWYYATANAARRLRDARARIAATATKETARKICIFSYPLVCRQVLYRGHAPVLTLAWSRDGKWLACASEDEMLHIWDATTGKERFHHTLSACPSIIDWSFDGAWIALGDKGGKLSFWEGATGRLHMTIADDTEKITGLAWSPLHNDVVASCSAQGRIRMYDLRQNALQWEMHRYAEVEALAWSPDGARLALGGNDSCIHLINAATGEPLQTYKKHRAAVRTLAWSPDSQLLASASDDPAILIWDALSGKKRRTIWSHLGSVGALAWSPDGTRLACAGSDPCVQVWDVHTGHVPQIYADHADDVTSVGWSPDSTMLASASGDGSVHIYAATGDPQ